jgi:hypothetical protein
VTFQHRVSVTLSLDAAVLQRWDRTLAFLEREGMTPEEEAAVEARINREADQLNAASGPQPSTK